MLRRLVLRNIQVKNTLARCSSSETSPWTRPPKRALIIKKRDEDVATAWTLRIADYLSRVHNIESFVEPAAVADLPSLPSVDTLIPNEPASEEYDGPAFDHSGSIELSMEKLASLKQSTPEPGATPTWQSKIDLAIAVGGDGTLLYLSSLFPKYCPPVITFFRGSLGFLMSFDPNHFDDVLDVCIKGRQPILNRQRLEFCVCSEEEWFRENGPGPETRWIPLLNETVIKRQHRLTGYAEIEAYCDDEYLARFKGDGLILASPTGSTAYSMSAGGSIVHPEIDSLLLTPLNSTTLASRPLLLPGDSMVRLHVRTDSCYLEGKHGRFVQVGELAAIRKAAYPLPCFTRDNPTADFVYDLSHRLMYQKQIRGRKFDPDFDKRELVPHFK